MRHLSIFTTLALGFSALAAGTPTPPPPATNTTHHIPLPLFASLEQLSRIVDISYCVGTTGIHHPFTCASRCAEFPDFELIDTFNTGPLMSDSCGFVALDHGEKRVLVVFRGTYSVANTIVDLSTVPQEYVPYPGNGSASASGDAKSDGMRIGKERGGVWGWVGRRLGWQRSGFVMRTTGERRRECGNCTVHMGFWTSWENTRGFVVPRVRAAREMYPGYRVELVGHSLGGAVAALAGLEFEALGWRPVVTTFGEPRVGNKGLRNYIDAVFALPSEHVGMGMKNSGGLGGRYRRVTHVDDPVPLLPLQEWGYRAHAGEVYISKPSLQPGVEDVRFCYGDEDTNCIAGAEVEESWFEGTEDFDEQMRMATTDEEVVMLQKRWGIPIPARYKMWQLFFAHRDYFWRLGLCVPGGDPLDWGRERYDLGDGEEEKIEL